jgi:phenylacetate-CoA ligase
MTRSVTAVLSGRIIAPLAAAREGNGYARSLRAYEQSQRWPEERLQAYRWERLQRLLQYAFENSPFYRARFAEAGRRPEDIRTAEDLAALPPLTKEDLREHAGEITTEIGRRRGGVVKETSGSTGVPLRVRVDREAMAEKWAATIRHNRWAGYDVGDRIGLIWGDIEIPATIRQRLRRALVDRVEVLDSQRLEARAMAAFAEALRRKCIRVLVAQAQPLCIFAEFLRAEGIGDLPVRAVIPTGMVLHGAQRQMLEQSLGWEVFDRYGAEETSVLASECEAHQGLHVNAEGLWLEVVTDDGPAGVGEEGELLVTDLTNRAMPLIRYQIGDVAAGEEGRCPCGRTLPRLRRMSGRVADCVSSPDGFVVSGIAITDHVTRIPGVRQMQVVQDQADHLLFRIVRAPEWTEGSRAQLGTLAARLFGPRMRFDCEFVPRIEADEAGKYRFCVSQVTKAFSRERREPQMATDELR